MRYTLLLSAVVGLTAAAPRPVPQELDLDAGDQLPEPTLVGPAPTAVNDVVAYPSSAVLSSILAEVSTVPSGTPAKVRRDAICSPQPSGSGPVPTPDTVSNFLAQSYFSAAASSAASAPPPNYTTAFTNLQGSTSQTGYMGLYTLKTYDPALCAAKCDAAAMCEAFNLYFERDPTVDPNDASCANPPSLTNIKCTLYGYPISGNTATNTGGYRGVANANGTTFKVAIAGSNGYVKRWTPPSYSNFSGPTSFAGSINAPLDTTPGVVYPNTYIGLKTYDTGRYDPSLCAAACQTQTQYDHDHPAKNSTTYEPCNFFNSYVFIKNGVPQGTYCTLYTRPWDASYATNTGQTRGSDVYTVVESFGYALTVQDSGCLW